MATSDVLVNLRSPHRFGRYDAGDLYPSGVATGIRFKSLMVPKITTETCF